MTPEEREELDEQIRQQERERNQEQMASFEEQNNSAPTDPMYLEDNPEEAQPEQPEVSEDVQPEQGEMEEEKEEEGPGLGETLKYAAFAAPLAFTDFAMDVIGKIPGLGGLDDAYDKATAFDNETLQQWRRGMSIFLPSVAAGVGITAVTGGLGLPAVLAGLAGLGGVVLTDVAITGLSDTSETDETVLTAVDEMFPWMNIPDRFITLDSDGPEVRREKNMTEAAGLSIVGEALGAAISIGKPVLRWFKPKDDVAKAALQKGKQQFVDSDTAKAAAELAETNPEEAARLVKQAEEMGASDATRSPLEAQAERGLDSRQMQIDEDAIRALEADPAGLNYNPDISSRIASEASTARQSIPPMANARNAVDSAAIKKGLAEGTPAPMITSSALKKGIGATGDSRRVVLEVAEEARQNGRFDTVVNGMKMNADEMAEAHLETYRSIVNPNLNLDEFKKLIRSLYIPRKVKPGSMADAMIEAVPGIETPALGNALKTFVDQYLGEEVIKASGRVMDTAGREITDMARAARQFEGVADPRAVENLLTDKLEFMMNEYALTKYLAGKELNDQKWWDNFYKQTPARQEELATELSETVSARRLAQSEKINGVMNELREAFKSADPRKKAQARLMIEAYDMTNGDVDSIAKLTRYFEEQISPKGMIVSKDGKMNVFARGLTAIRYQNILSGLSAANAALGTSLGLAIKPINAILGAGMEAMLTRDMAPIRATAAAYGSIFETNRRSLAYAWETFKRANSNPDFSIKAARKDIADVENEQWEFLSKVSGTLDPDKDAGKLLLWKFNSMNREVSRHPLMRLNTNLMIATDAYNSSAMASLTARQEAIYKHTVDGVVDMKAVEQTAKETYNKMFDSTGLIKNDAVEYASGELALNLDSDLANTISSATEKLPMLKSLLPFPRTGIEAFRLGVSYTPLAVIPGVSRTSDILLAGNNIDKIKAALQKHGIDTMKPTEDLMNTYKNLRNEYRGRLAFSGLLTTGLMGYAMDGGIIGNGDPNFQTRRNQQNTLDVQPYTLRLPTGQFISYRGWGEPFESVFSMLGDMAYYSNDLRGGIAEDTLTKLSWTFAATFTQKTFVSQLEPFVAVVTGDEGALKRLLASEFRAFVPLSGAQSVAQNAIDNARKDIQGDLQGYITSRNPILSAVAPNANLRDIFTGEILQDTSNPILRLFNAVTPFKISDGKEEWRTELYQLGYDGMAQIVTDGGADYPAVVRERLTEYVGKQKPYKRIQQILKMPKYQKDIKEIKRLRAEGYTSEQIQLKNYPLFREIDKVMDRAVDKAKVEIREEYPNIAAYINADSRSRRLQEAGLTDLASDAVDEMNELEDVLSISK